jgi:hypothetical protein
MIEGGEKQEVFVKSAMRGSNDRGVYTNPYTTARFRTILIMSLMARSSR